MSKIKLIATDIDGTILKYDFKFSQEVKDCITKLGEDGVKVVLVTGRMHSATDYIAEELGLDTPIVSYQGGLVHHKGKNLYERNLSPDYAREIINWVKKNDIHLNLYMNDELYVEKDDEVIRRYTGERHSGFFVKSFDEVKLERINKMLLIDFDDSEKITKCEKYLCEKYPDLHIVKSTPYFCEICHIEATKACAVNFLRDYWGLQQDEIMTIGDQNNDITLLESGGVRVAMGNATEELKAVADYITDSVNDDGFVRAVERFVYEQAKL